jgi:hypothetical protein
LIGRGLAPANPAAPSLLGTLLYAIEDGIRIFEARGLAAFATMANNDWRDRFLKAATPIGGTTPKNTVEAIAAIARAPWVNANELYALFDQAYPEPKDCSRRKAPFLPYLAYAPPDFALMLSLAGGGLCAPGKFMFDANGNLWSGVNWMPGSSPV